MATACQTGLPGGAYCSTGQMHNNTTCGVLPVYWQGSTGSNLLASNIGVQSLNLRQGILTFHRPKQQQKHPGPGPVAPPALWYSC